MSGFYKSLRQLLIISCCGAILGILSFRTAQDLDVRGQPRFGKYANVAEFLIAEFFSLGWGELI